IEPVAHRFDMNVARSKVDGLLEQVVYGPHDGGSARQITKTVDALVEGGGGLAGRRRRSRLLLRAKALGEHRCDFLERRDGHCNLAAENDLRAPPRRQVRWISDRE